MTEKSLPFLVAEFFKKHLEHLKTTKKNKIMLGNAYLTITEDFYLKLYSALPRDGKAEFGKNFGAFMHDFATRVFALELESALLKLFGNAPKKDEIDFSKVFFNEVISTPLSKLKLIVSVDQKRKSILYDEEKDFIYRYDFDFCMSRLRLLLGESLPEWLCSNSEDCLITYVPIAHERIFKSAKGEQKVFNKWTDAEWRRGWEPDPDQKCPAEFAEYLKLFFADDDSRYYAQAWLRDATFNRAEPILILCGVQGGGKNLFAQHIASALVGVENFRKASRGFNKSAFHNGVTECRIFHLDEMGLTVQARETLKDYHNGVATIERKGIDVGAPEPIHASFIITNNHAHEIRLDYADRKFFAPKLAPVDLKTSLGKPKIDHLLERLRDKEFVRQIASYLFCNFKNQEAVNFKKNGFFKELSLNSYFSAFRKFVHMCSNHHRFDAKTFNRGYSGKLDTFALQGLLNHYEANFGELATLEIDDQAGWVAVSKICKKPIEVEKPIPAMNLEIPSIPGGNGLDTTPVLIL